MTDNNELVRCGECKFWSETEKWVGRCLKSGFKTPKDFLGEDGKRKDQGMTDYTKLVEALRILQDKNSLSYYKRQVCKDAADAIEKLVTLYEKAEMDATNLTGKLAQAEAQLQKRGEWIDGDARKVTARCSVCNHLRLGNGAEWANKHVHFCEVCGSRMGDERRFRNKDERRLNEHTPDMGATD